MRVRCVVCGKAFDFEIPVPSELPRHKRLDDETMDCVGVLSEPA